MPYLTPARGRLFTCRWKWLPVRVMVNSMVGSFASGSRNLPGQRTAARWVVREEEYFDKMGGGRSPRRLDCGLFRLTRESETTYRVKIMCKRSGLLRAPELLESPESIRLLGAALRRASIFRRLRTGRASQSLPSSRRGRS